MKNTRTAAAPFGVWMLLFTIVPLGIVLWFALTDAQGHFTLQNLLVIGQYMDTFLWSILTGGAATLICLVLAYPLAYSIARATEWVQRTMVMIIMLPMWMNFLLRTYAWMSLLENRGFINQLLGLLGLGPCEMINTNGAVILGMVYNFLPFMVLPLYSVMAKLDPRVIEAAQDLGCNGWNVFRRIVLPLSVPGITAGITMVFVPAVSTFIITKMLGGGITGMLIGDVIESMFIGQAPNYNVGATLSLLLMVLMLLCMAFMGLADRDDDAIGGMMT